MNKKYTEMKLEELTRQAFLPPEALMWFENKAFELIYAWLQENGAPAQVVELFHTLNALEFLMRVPPDAFPLGDRKTWNAEMLHVVGEVGWGIKAMGGSFGDFWCKPLIEAKNSK